MQLMRKLLIGGASALLLGGVAALPAQAGQADICGTTSANSSSTSYASGATRNTSQTEDIGWYYTGSGCSFYQPSGITARMVLGGAATADHTWAPGDYSGFIYRTQFGGSYQLQWKSSPSSTQGKFHFLN
ncbi:hypothetical protein [Oryzihumus leptocrescens]|uniref:Peptidase inhibitor family I36 n=1 Tax=Oryzihumus leptocrescens TaxID=297536 RepID=A0A542ZIE5_9MICO|nr:hypothetical protein [Oryzihumus leptocrescens]TQL60096.1 hypothetical protein FB474_1475 [Oryzihumus leptocrescens]